MSKPHTAYPLTGSLYYNYSKSVNYGSSSSIKLTGSNYDDYTFYYNPSSTSNYTLSALTYVPSGYNYYVTIPFIAYYSSTVYVKGTIVVNVTNTSMEEIYYVTNKSTSAAISANDFYSKIHSATSSAVSYIQFTTLPSATEGTLYYSYTSSGSYGHKVSTTNRYYYSSSGMYSISSITFVPYTGFTGSASVTYVAYNSSGKAIAVGELSFGIVNSIEDYSDISDDAWYFKYVVELSDDDVVDGYPDGTFKPSGNVTYGEALKLIMLAAGYAEQAPTASHWASGYLSKALSGGLISSSVNLDSAITRLEMAKIAAKALGFNSSSSSTPFADTSNEYVLALYENGIVEGSFNTSGVRYFYPSNSITRAEISAIIWRINAI
jgi:hypothetical protein